jgi:hypothetical protein
MWLGGVRERKRDKLLRVRVNTRASKKEEKKLSPENYKCLNFVNDDIFFFFYGCPKK